MHRDCTSETILVREKIIVAVFNEKIIKQDLKNSWDFHIWTTEIIGFKPSPNVFQLINMIRGENKYDLQQSLLRYQQNLRGLGKLKRTR